MSYSPAAAESPQQKSCASVDVIEHLVRRILRSAYAVGIDKWGAAPAVDMVKHNEIALEIARQGIVLLKNDGVLPLATDRPLKVGVVGGYAQLGVPSGTGSGAVLPVGGFAANVNIGGAHGVMGNIRNLFLLPSSPLAELKKLLPQAQIEFDGGYTPAESALLAGRSDVVIASGFGLRAKRSTCPTFPCRGARTRSSMRSRPRTPTPWLC
jgi:beta-glucosidase